MRITLIKETKLKNKCLDQMICRYKTLASKFSKIDIKYIDNIEKFVRKSNQKLIALDVCGKYINSEDMAKSISHFQMNPTVKELVIVVGGPYGFKPEFKNIADESWSLSQLTFSGDIAWIVLLEQIYRALCIVNRHPYHHV